MNSSNSQLSLYRFSLPLNKQINFKGHGLSAREGLWLIKKENDGRDSLGEISPLPGFSQESLTECEKQILSLLNHRQAEGLPSLQNLLPSVSFALLCLEKKIPWKTLEDTAQLPSIPLLQGEFPDIIARYQQLNCPDIIKLKVARFPLHEEIKILQSLIDLNNNISFRLDANQQWTAQEYQEFLTLIDKQHIDYIEEPTASLADNLSISEKNNIHIALDETLLTTTQLPISHCITALIIKPTLIGHQQRIKHLLTHAKTHQLSVSISASFESPFALNQLAYLATQWQQEYQLSINLGLDTAHVFQHDILDNAMHTDKIETLLSEQAVCLWKS